MTRTRLEITHTAPELMKQLGEAAYASSNPKKVFQIVKSRLLTSIDLNFIEQRTPKGNPWPLSKAARRRGGKTLMDTGRLRASNQIRIMGNELWLQNKTPYASDMQDYSGGFLGLRSEDERDLIEQLRSHIISGFMKGKS